MTYNHNTNLHWETYKDNAGWCHIAVLDNLTDTCIYYYVGTRAEISTLHAELNNDAHPDNGCWESPELMPQLSYNEMRDNVTARMGCAWEINLDEEET